VCDKKGGGASCGGESSGGRGNPGRGGGRIIGTEKKVADEKDEHSRRRKVEQRGKKACARTSS